MGGNGWGKGLGEAHVSLTAAVQTRELHQPSPLMDPYSRRCQHSGLTQGFGLVVGPNLSLFHSLSRSVALRPLYLDGYWLQGQGLHVTFQKLFTSNVGALLRLPQSSLFHWRTSMCSRVGAPNFLLVGG